MLAAAALSGILVVWAAAQAGTPSTGNIPLNDLGSGLYKGAHPGGLYPDGANQPPPGHAAAALALAEQVVPRDTAGNPSNNGQIVMLSIGMSNNTQEFAAFERQEDRNTGRNARLLILNGSVGGHYASLIADPNEPYWQLVQDRLQALGVTGQQVQVVWLKDANRGPPDDFPLHAQALSADLRTIVRSLKDKFPNLRLCYLASRTYGGYATIPLNPEPQAYESGFSVQWLIRDQILGHADLNADPQQGPVEAPLLLWGPYLWADGITPRSDGLTWEAQEFEPGDGTHPAPAAEKKVADLLSAFFAAEPSAQPWYAQQPGMRLQSLDAAADAYVRADMPDTSFGTSMELLTRGGSSVINTYVRFDLRGVQRPVVSAKLSLRARNEDMSQRRVVFLVPDSSWVEGTLTFNTAPPASGGLLSTVPPVSRESTISVNVTQAVNADADGIVSFAIRTAPAEPGGYLSRESGQAPRLVLGLAVPTATPSPSGPTVLLGLLLAAAFLLHKRPEHRPDGGQLSGRSAPAAS